MTVTGAPPRSQPAAARRPALRGLLQPAGTPGKLRLVLACLVAACLVWGGVAAWIVGQRAAGAASVVATSEPLSLDGHQIYRALSDADATEATAFLSGGLEPIAARHRYQADIAEAASRLEAATALAGHTAVARDLATLSAGLPVYAGEVETARADNRLGLPLGAAYLREASALMRGTLLPAAQAVSAQADLQLTADSGQATGLPLAIVLLAVTIGAGFALYRSQRWLTRHTNRVLNLGLVVASAIATVAALWMVIALAVARADLLQARSHGSAPVTALARADIAALQARADEALTLIDASGDDSFQADFTAIARRLGPGPGTLLTGAVSVASGSPAAGPAAAAARAATAWYTAHSLVRSLDNNGQHVLAVQLVTTTGSGHSSTAFASLDSSLSRAITLDQAVFRTQAVAGRDAFTGLEVGVIVAALIMAAGCARGLTARLAEYR